MEHRKHRPNRENVLIHIVGASQSAILPREVLFKLGLRISRIVASGPHFSSKHGSNHCVDRVSTVLRRVALTHGGVEPDSLSTSIGLLNTRLDAFAVHSVTYFLQNLPERFGESPLDRQGSSGS